MFQIIIGILIVIIVILGAIYWYQQRTVKRAAGLKVQYQKLNGQNLEQQLADAQKLNVSGDSAKELEQLDQKYHQQVQPLLERLKKQLDLVAKDIHTSKFFVVGSQLNDIQVLINHTQSEMQSITASLNRFAQLQKAHQNAIDRIKQQYRHFHKVLDEKSFQYGGSVDALKERLTTLEKQYDQFTDLTDKGDFDGAEKILNDLKHENAELEAQIKQIPDLYRPLATEFPTQLDELQSGYDQLVAQHYHFTTKDIPDQIQTLQERRTNALEKLTKLDISDLARTNKEMADQIDDLYATMQKELDAKPQTEHLMKTIGKFVEHAAHQNDELSKELDRLSINYSLNNHEIEDTRSLGEQINNIKDEYETDQKAIADQIAVYSQVLDRQTENEKSLTQIEEQQAKINDEVAKLQTDEQRAKQMLQKYATQIRALRRQVDQLNLPGFPKDYLNYFFGVSDEIKKLADELSQYRVDMDEVTKQLIIVESDLETLRDKTDDVRDSAELTERLQQYANRFSDNQKISTAAAKSREQFEQFKYTTSLETIATALEEVEPGSYKRIEDSYYAELKEN